MIISKLAFPTSIRLDVNSYQYFPVRRSGSNLPQWHNCYLTKCGFGDGKFLLIGWMLMCTNRGGAKVSEAFKLVITSTIDALN